MSGQPTRSASALRAVSFRYSPSDRAVSFRYSPSALSAVSFRYSPSALDHLALLDDERPQATAMDDSTAKNEMTEGNSTSSLATFGALGAMALTIAICQLVVIPQASISSEYADFITLLAAAASAIAGYKLLGGDEARAANLPKDGGYDAKFVVDKPGRIRDIVGRIKKEKGYNLVVSSKEDRDLSDALRLINQVHGEEYIAEFKEAVEDAKQTGRIRRLHPVVMRTLIDEHSYDAAVAGVADWIDSVDTVMTPETNANEVSFALTRPPSHHA